MFERGGLWGGGPRGGGEEEVEGVGEEEVWGGGDPNGRADGGEVVLRDDRAAHRSGRSCISSFSERSMRVSVRSICVN